MQKYYRQKYHRTTNEAFHNTAEYGAAIEKSIPKMFTKGEICVYLIAVIVILLDMFIWRP